MRAFAAALLLAAATPAPSATPNAAALPAVETPYWKVETIEIHAKDNGDFTMPQHVAFSRPGSDGTADRAEGNSKRGTVSLVGNVVVHDNGGAEEAKENPQYAEGGPSTLTCDRLDIDQKALVYTAIGTVKFVQGERTMTSDRARWDRQLHQMVLSGHVYAANATSHMRADVVNYNTESKAFSIDGHPMVIVQPVPSRPPRPSPSPTASAKPRR